MASRAKKLRWFDAGAAAFERTYPGVIKSQFGDTAGPMYVCPLCDEAFERQAVTYGHLTAEHVPPAGVGGRDLVLTCRQCNNAAGAELDADARTKEILADAFTGTPVKALRGRLRYAGHQLHGTFSKEGDAYVLRVGPNNAPDAVEAFQAVGPPSAGTPIHFDFADRFHDRGAKVSWLRAGYLTLFAVFGYRFVFDPALEIVKRQIADFRTAHIHCFTITTPKSVSWSERKILQIRELSCAAVQFGRYVVLFPNPGDVAFYNRLEAHVRASADEQTTVATAELHSWPLEPLFGYQPDC